MNQVKRATRKVSYQEAMDMELRMAQQATDERRELTERIAELKKVEDNHLRRITRMNKLAGMARYLKVGAWVEGGAEARNAKMLAMWELQTSAYHFKTYVWDRDDLKSYRYEVHVQGTHTTLGETPHEVNGGYANYSYVKDKYKGMPAGHGLIEKFKTLKAAEEYAKLWQKQLSLDHEFEIVEDQALTRHAEESGFVFSPNARFYTNFYK